MSRMRKPWLPALVGLVAVGCVSGAQWTYDKRNTTPAQVEHDLGRCRKEAFRPQRFAIFHSDRYDYDVLNRCMERRGYQVRPAEP
jgi:hypothetical protein